MYFEAFNDLFAPSVWVKNNKHPSIIFHLSEIGSSGYAGPGGKSSQPSNKKHSGRPWGIPRLPTSWTLGIPPAQYDQKTSKRRSPGGNLVKNRTHTDRRSGSSRVWGRVQPRYAGSRFQPLPIRFLVLSAVKNRSSLTRGTQLLLKLLRLRPKQTSTRSGRLTTASATNNLVGF